MVTVPHKGIRPQVRPGPTWSQPWNKDKAKNSQWLQRILEKTNIEVCLVCNRALWMYEFVEWYRTYYVSRKTVSIQARVVISTSVICLTSRGHLIVWQLEEQRLKPVLCGQRHVESTENRWRIENQETSGCAVTLSFRSCRPINIEASILRQQSMPLLSASWLKPLS